MQTRSVYELIYTFLNDSQYEKSNEVFVTLYKAFMRIRKYYYKI